MAWFSAAAEITVCIITSCIRPLPHAGRDSIEGNRTLQTLALHCAGHLVGPCYVAIDKQIGCGASAAAIKPRPALPAGGTGIDILLGKLSRNLHIKGAVIDAAHAELLFSHKLVAGVDVSVRRDGHILAASAAAPQPLDDAGALGQVHVEVEEIDILPLQQGLG